jgi:hypothetical protein
VLRCEPEAFVGRAFLGDQACQVFADRRSVLEAVARAAADQPYVPVLGVPVDQEIAVAGVLVLANLRRNDRRI